MLLGSSSTKLLISAFGFCAAGQEDSGKVQPLPGCGEPEQTGGGGVVHGSPDVAAHRHPGLLLHPCVHDGVSLHPAVTLSMPTCSY